MGKGLIAVSIVLFLLGGGTIIATMVITKNIDKENKKRGDELADMNLNNSLDWGVIPGNREYEVEHNFYLY